MNNIHQSRLTALRYHVPGAVTLLLIAVAMVATGFTGYYAGHRVTTFVMSLTIAVVIMLVIDRDLIRVPVQALIVSDGASGDPEMLGFLRPLTNAAALTPNVQEPIGTLRDADRLRAGRPVRSRPPRGTAARPPCGRS